jgi:glycosyltransferase involved in cell wall biosynthesis
MIVGSHPPKTIQALRSAHVVVTGRVDDLRPVFENAQVFVAPLRYGAGVKGKLYSAMAYGAPIVTTSIGAEGIGLTPDRDALIADTPAAFAKAVIRTFNDPTLAQTLAAAGPSFVAENATLAAGVAVMRRALEKAAADRRQATVW